MAQSKSSGGMPAWVWFLLMISPIDALPDWVLGPVGFVDDLFYLVMFCRKLAGGGVDAPALPPARLPRPPPPPAPAPVASMTARMALAARKPE